MVREKQTAQNREAAFAVIERLKAAGHRALVAGGAVRDLLLDRPPGDFDVSTSATPDEVKSLFDRVIPVGERYGVLLVVTGGAPVEVATFRSDAKYLDGRRPTSVRFTKDPAEDAARRDFTINGLFLDPDSGEVMDFVGGRADLGRRRIRCIGDPRERFREDRLRLFRAVRFCCGLDFEIEKATFDAMKEAAPGASLLSAERTRDELIRILTGPRRGRGLELLSDAGLLGVVLPEVDAMKGVTQPPEFHPEGDVFRHTCLVLDALERPDEVLALAGLLHDVGKPPTRRERERIRFDRHAEVGAEMAEEICRRLRVPRSATAAVVELVRRHLVFMSVTEMREARLRRFLTGSLAEEHLALHRADCLASHRDLSHWRFCKARREDFLSEPAPVERLVTGRDLIDLGLTPGPRFAEILREVEDQRLEGRLSVKEEAMRFVRDRYMAEGREDA